MSSGSILDTAKITADIPPEMREVASIHNCAVDLVAHLLRNPTDEQVDAIGSRLDLVDLTYGRRRLPIRLRGDLVEAIVRAVLAAAAGGSCDV